MHNYRVLSASGAETATFNWTHSEVGQFWQAANLRTDGTGFCIWCHHRRSQHRFRDTLGRWLRDFCFVSLRRDYLAVLLVIR